MPRQSALACAQAEPASVGGPTPINCESLAVDEAALGRVGEEEDRAGDIVGSREASHGDTAGDVIIAVSAACLVGDIHFCFDPAWTNSVDSNASAAPLSGKRAGEPNKAMFGGVIGSAVADTDEAGDGSDIDDTALSLLKHECTESPAENEGCNQVDLKHAAERRCFNGLGSGDEADACIVHEHIGAAPALLHQKDSLCDERFVCDVTDERFRLGASRTQRGERRVARLQIEQQERVTSFAKELGGSPPDPLRCSRYDRDSHMFTVLVVSRFRKVLFNMLLPTSVAAVSARTPGGVEPPTMQALLFASK